MKQYFLKRNSNMCSYTLQRRSNKLEELSKTFRYFHDVAVPYWLYDLLLLAGHKNLP